MNKELEFIRKAVIMACNSHWDWKIIDKNHYYMSQPVTLAMVLITLPLIETFLWRGHLEFTTPKGYCSPVIKFKWNLTKDLDQQEPKTILSIAKLLGYENK